jgi:lipopolysaccharide export system ATP-binding protein
MKVMEASPGAAGESRRASTTDSAPSRLEARGLKKSYGSRLVVKDVTLAVDKGEVVGLLGPNGAGKTTSFYMLVGLRRLNACPFTAAPAWVWATCRRRRPSFAS